MNDHPIAESLHPIAEYLQRHGLSIVGLAKKTGVCRTSLTRVISGTRRNLAPESLRALLAVIGKEVTADQILMWKPPPKPKLKK